MSTLIYVAIPFFVVTMLLELRLLRGRGDVRGYESRDSAASLAMGIGNVLISAGTKAVALGFYTVLHEASPFEIPLDAWWAWPAVLLLDDFCYYWFHRFHHEVRFLWAAHVNHHSSEHFNLSTALRQSWTTPFTAPIFWLPVALLGFPPEMLLTAQGISLLYQYWIHTEWIDRIGPLEAVLNTPSHHRVHHGRNPEYLDRNYAGILILWDKLFGSFEPEVAPVDYGITKPLESFNPLWIAVHDWVAMARQVASAKTLRAGAMAVLGRPGWSDDGSTLTAPQMRERAVAEERVAAAASG